MLDALLSLLEKEAGIGHLADILNNLESVLKLVAEDYLKDGNAKNAAIDAIIQILQQHKTP